MPAAYLLAPDVHAPQPCVKISFASERHARKQMNKMRPPLRAHCQIGQGVLNVYRCRFCPGWHVGHAPLPYQRNS